MIWGWMLLDLGMGIASRDGMIAIITANSDWSGKAIKIQIYDAAEPEKRETWFVDSKSDAMLLISRRERILGRKMTIECCI